MTVEEYLRCAIDLALEAGHCYPVPGSDRGQCLIDHVTQGRRDRITLREEVERLKSEVEQLSKERCPFMMKHGRLCEEPEGT